MSNVFADVYGCKDCAFWGNRWLETISNELCEFGEVCCCAALRAKAMLVVGEGNAWGYSGQHEPFHDF